MKSLLSAQRINSFARRHENRVLAAMLLLLHLSTWWTLGDNLSKSLMLTHLGLFFLWQPIWSGERRLDLGGGLVFLVFTLGFIWTLSWWTLICWLVVLIGLVGGRTLTTSQERYIYMLTLIFLISILVIRGVPGVIGAEGLGTDVVTAFTYGLLLVPVLIFFFPENKPDAFHGPPTVDLFRAVAVSLMTTMVCQGALLIMYLYRVGYSVALFESLIVLAAFLFTISWLLSPRVGARGLAQLWERSLLNIGTPFELWLAELAHLAEKQQTPGEFLDAAMLELSHLHWVSGVQWQTADGEGSSGTVTPYAIAFEDMGLKVRLHAFRPPGPMLVMHSKLLMELLLHFYVAKLREQELARQAHLQAIYETGARVTHDIKNLLQSLQAITMVLVQDRAGLPAGGEDRRQTQGRGRQLLEKQLPLIAQRLQLALDKLQSPDKAAADERPLGEWWESLKARNQAAYLRFDAEIRNNPVVPTDLFDSVAENLLENARNKRRLEPDLKIALSLRADDSGVSMKVSDDGSPVPEDKARELFNRPVASHFGLGIGLYQAARQAQLAGYRLSLADNRPGAVTFELRSAGAADSSDPQYPLFAAP